MKSDFIIPTQPIHLQLRYSEMGKHRRKLYRKWLEKNNMWDSEVVIENQLRMGILKMDKESMIEYSWVNKTDI